MRFLSEDDVRAVLRYETLIPAMEQALSALSRGEVIQPLRAIVPLPAEGARAASWFAQMPAVLPASLGGLMGAKLVTVFPGNAQRALPTHMALIQLFRSDTGEPVVAMDGRLITEMRTAAVSAVALRHLSGPGRKRLAILGAGVQARAHREALPHVAEIGSVRVWGRDPEKARAFATAMDATAAATPDEAVEAADVIVTATAARDPILRGEWLRPDCLVLAVGAVGPTVRELDDGVLAGASVVADARVAVEHESADVMLSGAPVYAELGEIMAGLRPAPGGKIIFKSVGLAVEDIAAATLVWQALGGPLT